MKRTVLVTEATGALSGIVIPQLLEQGINVRVFSTGTLVTPEYDIDIVEVYKGSWNNQESFNYACKDCDTVLWISSSTPNIETQCETVINGVRNLGFQNVVRISTYGASLEAPTTWGRLNYGCDQELISNGCSYTILRPSYLMQNIFNSVQSIKEEGALYLGFGEGKVSMIDIRDLADCIVTIIVNGGHENKIYTPTGPEAIDFGKVATSISSVIGKTIEYVPVDLDVVKNTYLNQGLSEWNTIDIVEYSKACSEDWCNYTTDHVETITGRKSRSIDEFSNEVLKHEV